MPNSKMRPRIRVAVVLLSGNQVLLVEHTKDDRSYWLLPGGGLEWGESLHQAATREVEEETGYRVEIGDLQFVSETLSPDNERHVVHLVLGATVVGGELTVPDEARITDVRWFDLESLKGLTLHPPMQRALSKIGPLDERGKRIYLGNLWVD